MNQLALAISASQIWGKVWPFLIAVLFFGIIIFIHELGHFIFAKAFKVKVHEFAMGMGPAILKFGKKDTKYSLRLFPVGGFVSMEGEDEQSESGDAFCNKPVWQRIIILAAGATMNLILGIVIVAVMLSGAELIGTNQIHSFHESAISNASLAEGDEILEINGRRLYSEYDLGFLMSRDGDGVMDFTVRRNGEKIELNDVKFDTRKNADGTVTIIYDFIIVGVEPGFLSVIRHSFGEAVSLGRMVWLSLFDLVTGRYGLSDLSGPIGTVNIIADAAEHAEQETDYSYLLTLMALITINIGLFNLLPIPALDGGKLFFSFIELIFRKPVPRKFEHWLHAIGFVLLIVLMLVISMSDIINLIKN